MQGGTDRACRGPWPRRNSTTRGGTGELLKPITRFREGDERLLVCATDSIRSLDPAFLRPGRCDHLVPIGTPDKAARAAIRSRYADGRSDVDVSVPVSAGDPFTPADTEHATRIAAQTAFERDLGDRFGADITAHDRV